MKFVNYFKQFILESKFQKAESDGKVVPAKFTKEGGNKIVDINGNPLKVYHGTTTKDFVGNKFIIGWDVQGLYGDGAENIGIFFGNKKQAEEISRGSVTYGAERSGQRIIESYISLKNPLRLTKDAKFWFVSRNVLNSLETDSRVNIKELRKLVEEHEKLGKIYTKNPITATQEFEVENDTVAQVIRPYLQGKGFDGIIYENQVDAVSKGEESSGESYIVFNPDDIINTDALKTTKEDDETIRSYGTWKLGESEYIDSDGVYTDLPDSAATPQPGVYKLEIIPISSTDLYNHFTRVASGAKSGKGTVPALSREYWAHDDYDGYQTDQLNMIKKGWDTPERKPIIVEEENGVYKVIDGHHRLTIAKELGKKSILALVRKEDNS